MATSGSYSFGVSRDDIVRQALLNIGKIDRYDIVDGYLMQDCVLVLNMLVKQMMGTADFAQGLKVWTRKRGHRFLSNSTGRYSLGPNATGWTNSYTSTTLSATTSSGSSITVSSITGMAVGYHIGVELDSGDLQWFTIVSIGGYSNSVVLSSSVSSSASAGNPVYVYQTTAQIPLLIESAVLRDEDSSDNPLRILRTTQDYDYLPSKAQTTNQQDPTAIYFETQLGDAYIYIDAGAAADVRKHIVLTYQEPVQDFVNPTDTPYYPPEYYLALCWGLSKLICPQMNRVWTPHMEEILSSAMAVAKHKDPELTSLYFQPGEE